jgi:hypothetical protein
MTKDPRNEMDIFVTIPDVKYSLTRSVAEHERIVKDSFAPMSGRVEFSDNGINHTRLP